ncbi:hypothetical protein Cgig2_013699 [Carnegiea gigantea]|uniref:Uncharacterized protein n=1 Tax=Carnegiea gigantea TaxID=171969 RepID=A0A9Q1QGT4_9CARY|nr:hypothetical protein Cgig2_013699 [Carnegiea gigantea]
MSRTFIAALVVDFVSLIQSLCITNSAAQFIQSIEFIHPESNFWLKITKIGEGFEQDTFKNWHTQTPRARITLEEYLKSVQHEDTAGEDVSLDNIDMIPDFEEEVEHVGENIFESRVSINMNPSLINIPDDFKDDKEEKEHQREPGPLEWFMETHQDKEGSYHEPATKKFVTGASKVVFSEATVPAETLAYHKLMGPESSGRVRGVGSGVTSNQLIANRNCQSGTEPLDSSIGDDVEENQRNNTFLTGEPIRDTYAHIS